jgi:RNA polymerase sigma factor (sigma-70 family)
LASSAHLPHAHRLAARLHTSSIRTMTDEEITAAYEHFDFMVNCARLRGAGEDAEDVAQEAWASLLPALRAFQPETDDDLLRLLLGTVKRRVIDYLRRRNTHKRDHHRTDPEAYDGDEPPMPEDEPLSAEEHAASGQIADRL